MERLRRFVFAIERRGASGLTPALAAAWIGGLRISEEYLFVYLPRGMRREPMVWFGHVSLFYLALVVSLTTLLVWTTRRAEIKVQAAVAAGLLLGVLPPFIDVAAYGQGGFNYTYSLDFFKSFSPWLYAAPEHIPLGEAVTVWLSMLFMGAYAALVGARPLRVLLTLLGHYGLIIVFLVVLPSSAVWITERWPALHVNLAMSLLLVGVTTLAFLLRRPALTKRALLRLPHALFAPSLAVLGSAIVGRLDVRTVIVAASLFVSALVFTLQNDFYDRKEDALGGRPQLISRSDAVFLATLPVGLWLTLSAGYFWVALAGLLFAVVAHGYQADPYRLKCVFPLSYKSEALLALVCLGAGMLVHPGAQLSGSQLAMAACIAAGASVIAMAKDVKDIGADRQAGVRTLYVVLSSRGLSDAAAHRLVLLGVGFCVAIPVLYFVATGTAPMGTAGLAVLAVAIVTALSWTSRVQLAVLSGFTLLNAYLFWGAYFMTHPSGM